MSRKNILIVLFILFYFVNTGLAQITFQKTYGGIGLDDAFAISQTMDGGYIIGGCTNSYSSINLAMYILKVDSLGDINWTKSYGRGGDDCARSIVETPDGGYIIGGTTDSGYSDSLGFDNTDVYIIKIDSIGNIQWDKTYGGASTIDDAFLTIPTIDGGYASIGNTIEFSGGQSFVYFIKTNSFGDTLWTKEYSALYYTRGYSFQQASDSGYIIVGAAKPYGSNNSDIYVLKTDSNGIVLWSKTIGGVGFENATSVQQTIDGGFIVAGSGGNDIYLIKTNAIGDTLWTRAFGGNNTEQLPSVRQTNDGGFIVVGSTFSFGAGTWDIYLVKIDALGNLLWSKTFGGSDYDYSHTGHDLQITNDGGYIFTGQTRNFGSGYVDIYLIKTDSLGNSGCNEGSPATILMSPVAQVTNTPTIITSPTTNVTSAITIIGSGCSVNTLCFSVGINEFPLDKLIRISPNPSDGVINIYFETPLLKGNIEVLDTFGKIVFRQNIFSETNKEIKLVNISNGIFFVKIFDGERIAIQKLIINHY